MPKSIHQSICIFAMNHHNRFIKSHITIIFV
nr:MAG TPA: hypothetical protein [Caudoviricetes sp.]